MNIWGGRFGRWALIVAAMSTTVLIACKDEKKKAKTEESDDDDDSSSKKKKKPKDDDEDAGPKPIQVASIPGFVVPGGGVYQHISVPSGGVVLEFENYTYASATHPRAKRHSDFKKELEKAGWVVTKDTGPGYIVKKEGAEVSVAFGEVDATQTKINVFPLKKVAAPGSTPVFAGTFTSKFGTVTLTQTKAQPTQVNGRYTGGSGGGPGTMVCGVVGAALLCAWREGGLTGQADFVQDSAGNLNGTWGMGKDSRGNGPWILTRTAPGALE